MTAVKNGRQVGTRGLGALTRSTCDGMIMARGVLEQLYNQKFGRLVALEPVQGSRRSRRQWLCRCDCGRTVRIQTARLVSPAGTRSWGCLRVERLMTTGRNVKHGHAAKWNEHPLYCRWEAMRARCSNPSNHKYHLYGGRGISVCRRWDDFTAFLADVGMPPSDRHSLDRIDGSGDYEPENVRWATPKEQRANSRPRGRTA